jgi:hypothetical protein
VRGTACAGVCTRVRLLLPESRVGVATGCRGGVHVGARLNAMGDGERGARGWLARTRRGAWRCVQGDRERGVPSSWRLCARPTWPWRGHGGAAVLGTAASDGVGTKMGQRPGLASRVAAHACWVHAWARALRNARMLARTHTRRERDASMPARRGSDRNRAASYG